MANCPVCNREAANVHLTDYDRRAEVNCRACGNFEGPADLTSRIPDHCAPRLSHQIRKMQRPGERSMIDLDLAKRLIREPLPSVREQADNFLLWAGNELRDKNPVAYFQLYPPAGEALLSAMIGAFDGPSAWVIVTDMLVAEGLVSYRNDAGTKPEVRLTAKGWDRYEELRHSVIDSRLAFMAMPFNNSLLDRVFEDCFRPAVAATGFDLRRIIDKQKAGLIDDQLRVAIRRARFAIADLTFGNAGV